MASPLPNPLLQLHEQAEAELQPYDQTQIVSTFGIPELEYAAIRKSAGWMDLPQRGVLELTGKDRLAFLNNLLTNQTWSKETKSGLAAGQGVYAFFLNTKGRIVADMNVLELGEKTLLEMDGRFVEPVRAAFDKYLFVEQVKMVGRVGTLHEMALHGPRALELLTQVTEPALTELAVGGAVECRIFETAVTVWRDDPAGVPGYFLLVPSDQAVRVWTGLLERFGGGLPVAMNSKPVAAHTPPARNPLRAVGWATFNATRIEAGRPIFGIDFDDSTLPAETGQFARAVSVTKGCYLGQEIVARMHARSQVAKQLVGIKMDEDALPMAGNRIYDAAENEVGAIMSSTVAPILSGAAICLGYVKKPLFGLGTALTIPAEGKMRVGHVVELPFYRPESS